MKLNAACGVRIAAVSGLVMAVLVVGAQPAVGQAARIAARAFAANVVVPQSRVYAGTERRGGVAVTDVRAEIVIRDQVAVTSLEIGLENAGGSRAEAEVLLPVPDNVTVKGFTFQGTQPEGTAELLPKDEARRIYDSIVAKMRDPALLEFAGCNLVRSSVFPVEGHGKQRVRLIYEQLLIADNGRIDYTLPRSESLSYRIPWSIDVRIHSRQRIATVYSPSHAIESRQPDDSTAVVSITESARWAPGSFRLSYLPEQDGVSATWMAYPGGAGTDGYFLMLAGVPAGKEAGGPAGGKDVQGREVILVLDRSGSMSGDKIKQACQAVRQIIVGLEETDAFNILVYNEEVDSLSGEPVRKTRASVDRANEYLDRIQPRGGTNLHDALREALRQKCTDGMLPIVLFLTDGLPTVGQLSEGAIRKEATANNPYKRRVFTFGVGLDVNTPLLEGVAYETRGRATFVLPGEDVEVKVAGVFNRLAGPVLSDPELTVLDADGKPAPGRVRDVLPQRMPDLFAGDQLVLLGRFEGEGPLSFAISGNYRGRQRAFRFRFDNDKATVKHAFVPRLWASRRIGLLVDAIRQAGADPSAASLLVAGRDPRTREWVDEIVRLSTEFGILTEYTAFLARDGTDLTHAAGVRDEAVRLLAGRAMGARSGMPSVNQEFNAMAQKSQALLNARNEFLDENLNKVQVSSVQQMNDLAFFQRNGRWEDSRLVANAKAARPDRVVEFGSDEFRALAERLAAQGRQGAIALAGDILLRMDGETVLVRNR